MAGFKVGPDTKNTVAVLSSPGLDLSETYDFRMNTSDSPAASGDYENESVPTPPPPPLIATPVCTASPTISANDCSCSSTHPVMHQEIAFVGLVNQAMTCYLNSLLQALFMTPEFRNAIYNWEFDGSPNEESKSIPYQLQKLFLNLQTSRKSAVETTELTRSFGWNSWEAWQQHDIQELCRVMFDTLEQKFKNTKQADLINRLYEGKMIDYVKCLECSTEKSREDTFLDIPLPMRSFSSDVAYGSVEEALRAFVQPETLDGNNQYHCDTCNKKCDAHKGLKFSKFPYLLTLHLKRFDFDFNTLHRIKLNNKVSFPEKLNLNSFIAESKSNETNSETSPEDMTVKCDDSCTTDSGSALDDEVCHGIDTINVPNIHENHSDFQDDDEGIDMGQHHEKEKNGQSASEIGPYIYELFSIMIHSGSAAGGHYYVYIKDFRDGEWYCFNDQNVSRITYEDIKKTYGGGPLRGCYSSAFSSSANAYMLMYRQIDKERNVNAMTTEEFPEHIKVLYNKLKEQKELDSAIIDADYITGKLKIYCHYPHLSVPSEVVIDNDSTLRRVLQKAYKRLNLDKIVPIERCRLIAYDKSREVIECSFEGKEDEAMGFICVNHGNDFLMEVRGENEEFEVYRLGDVLTRVVVVNIENEEVKSSVIVRANLSHSVGEYKEMLAKHLKLHGDFVVIALEKFNRRRLLHSDDFALRLEDFYNNIKVFVAEYQKNNESDFQKDVVIRKLYKIIDKFEHVITLYVTLPDVDNDTLARLNILPLEQSKTNSSTKQNNDELLISSRSRGASPNHRDLSPQPLPDPEDECIGPAGPHSDQSTSEDSSLTDSDRTIVGETPGDYLSQLSSNSSPPGSDHNVSSSETETNDCSFKTIDRYDGKLITSFCRNSEGENWDVNIHDIPPRGFNYYFKAVPHQENNLTQNVIKVMVDKRMYRRKFKQCLEPLVGVSAEHFKIYPSCYNYTDMEFSALSDTLDIYKDNEKIVLKLGRALKKGEYQGNVFLLAPNSEKPIKYLFEWVIANGSPVSQVKKEILEELKRKCAIEIPLSRCRLRKKNWKTFTRPYLDDTTFDDLSNNWELFVQELSGDDPVTSPNQKLLMVRQLGSSLRDCRPFEEIVLNTNTVSEFKEKLSELSGIPAEFIETGRAPVSFPCLDLSLLMPCTDIEWNSWKPADESAPIIYDESHVIFYRDSRDKSKMFLTKEKKLLKDRRNRLYSPIKERALKIYLDTAPSRKDESDVD